MPITVQVPEGIFTPEQEDEIFITLTHTILEINGATGNPFALRHLIGDVQRAPMGKSYGGGKPDPFVNITVRAPSFSLDNRGKFQLFVTKMTDLVVGLSGGKIVPDRVYINMIVGDGFWGVGGVAMDEETLMQTAAASMPSMASMAAKSAMG